MMVLLATSVYSNGAMSMKQTQGLLIHINPGLTFFEVCYWSISQSDFGSEVAWGGPVLDHFVRL